MSQANEDAIKTVLARGANIRQANIIVYRSLDPEARREDWEPVMKDDVPDWVKEPGTMGDLINGQMAHNDTQGGYWYRAEKTGQIH